MASVATLDIMGFMVFSSGEFLPALREACPSRKRPVLMGSEMILPARKPASRRDMGGTICLRKQPYYRTRAVSNKGVPATRSGDIRLCRGHNFYPPARRFE